MARRSPVGGRRPRASPMTHRDGEHGVDDQVPEHDRQQREGEDVDVLAVADLLEEGAEREGGQRQQHADPGTPRRRAGGLRQRAVALPQLADEQLGALLDEPLGRRLLAALAGAPAREFRGRAGGVLPVGLGDQRAIAVRAFDGADQQDIAGGVFVHGCIIAGAAPARRGSAGRRPGARPGRHPIRAFLRAGNPESAAKAQALTLVGQAATPLSSRMINIKWTEGAPPYPPRRDMCSETKLHMMKKGPMATSIHSTGADPQVGRLPRAPEIHRAPRAWARSGAPAP